MLGIKFTGSDGIDPLALNVLLYIMMSILSENKESHLYKYNGLSLEIMTTIVIPV